MILENLPQKIYENYVGQEKNIPKRTHLGASSLGEKCHRSIFYDFRWYDTGIKDGRILRLFNTGKREEERLIDNLKSVGFKFFETEIQHECRDNSGHIGGSVDGIIISGLDNIKSPMILEIKTHSEKNFRKFKDEKLKTAFTKHYSQIQIYMGLMEIKYTLYAAINKNTDELYFEIVDFDQDEFNDIYQKAKEIVIANFLPPKIRESASWFECKMCKFYGICHKNETPTISCRNCVHSSPTKGGKWVCKLLDKELSYENQIKGCNQHTMIA